MRKQLYKLLFILSFSTAVGQVGINTTTPQAQLEIKSSNQAAPTNTDGILIPKIDAFPVTNPTTAQNGMMVFLTTTVGIKPPGFYYWDNTTSTWIGLASSTSGWALTGNIGTASGTNFIGTTDAQALDIRTNNILRTRFTTKGQIETLNTGNSVFVGEGAGANDDLSDNRNTFIGLNAGQTNTTSTFNTGIGYQALQNNTSNGATAVGYNALQNYTGIRGTAVGFEALKATTTGSSNTAVGYAALSKNTTGGNNTAMGNETLLNITTGSNNTGFGKYALLFSTTAIQNTAVGVSAMHTNTTGGSNTAMGFQAMGLNNTGNNNVALGLNAMYTNTTGSNNMALGSSADVTTSGLSNASAIGYNAKVSTSSSMVLGGTGADAVKVGIGTTSPTEELEVVGDIRTSSLAGTGTRMVQADTNGTLTPLAAGTASQVLLGTGVWGSVPGITNDWSATGNSGTNPATNFLGTTDAKDLVIKTNSTETARMTTAGNFGIGTNAPASRLHIKGGQIIESGTLYMNSPDNVEKILLTDWGDNGSKINTSWNFSVDFMAGSNGWDTDGNHRFFTSVVGTGFTERMRIHSNGNVGIGSTAPIQAKLVIIGTQDSTLSYGYLQSDGTTGTSSGTSGYSIYASGKIAATEFNAFSDKRIKNIKGISNSSKDLETLNKIQITDYTFKDSIGKGTGLNKKVIAQQVEKVYPQAVSKITDIIPDIYSIAKIKDGRIILKNTLQKGDRVKLVFENRTEMAEVLQADEYGFNIALNDEGKVFVYGREVKDFHTVDYEALSTLNISATQELIKIINQQETQIRNLKADNADMNKRLSQTEADVAQIKSILNSTVSEGSK
ncbi:tail fiber domain-containing protein [Flavobacterium pedocola]